MSELSPFCAKPSERINPIPARFFIRIFLRSKNNKGIAVNIKIRLTMKVYADLDMEIIRTPNGPAIVELLGLPVLFNVSSTYDPVLLNAGWIPQKCIGS